MEKLNLKPTHKPVQNYYQALRQFRDLGVSHEGAAGSLVGSWFLNGPSSEIVRTLYA